VKLEDFGIDSKTGIHNQKMTRAENIFVGILWVDHVGIENAIPADDLAIRFAVDLDGLEEMTPRDFKRRKYVMKRNEDGRKLLDMWKRDVRKMHNHLLKQHDHMPILSRAGTGGGYWIAESDTELDAFYNAFRQRGLTGLVKASRGKKAVLVEMVQQLSFDFDLEDKMNLEPVQPGSDVTMPGEVVDQFLEQMLANPERYAKDIQKISKKYGGVLIGKFTHQAIKRKVRELERLLQ
jgi:hypothetical protein